MGTKKKKNLQKAAGALSGAGGPTFGPQGAGLCKNG